MSSDLSFLNPLTEYEIDLHAMGFSFSYLFHSF